MSFATRCPACGTTFRIAAAQLDAADGWVRCGRCGEPFDAAEVLVAGEADDGRTTGADGATDTGYTDVRGPADNEAARSDAGIADVTTSRSAVHPDFESPPSGATSNDRIDGGPPAATYDDGGTLPPVVEPSTAGDRAASPGDPAGVGAAAAARDPTSAAGSDEDAGTDEADATASIVPASAIALAASGRPASPAADPAADAFRDEPLDATRPPALQPSSAGEAASPTAAVDAPAASRDVPPVGEGMLPGLQAGLSRQQAVPPAKRDDLSEAALPGPRTAAGDTVPAELDLPSFAGTADDDAETRRPHRGLQAALAAGGLLLALALALQAAWHWRDLIAAAWPPSRPTLDALCRAAGCRIEPLRRLEGVTVESSALIASPSGRAIQLALVLRNRGGLPVALPWVDLALTEVNGRLLVRRALSPADLGATSATIAPSAEATLRATLAVEGRPPSGYTVELFQP